MFCIVLEGSSRGADSSGRVSDWRGAVVDSSGRSSDWLILDVQRDWTESDEFGNLIVSVDAQVLLLLDFPFPSEPLENA